MNQDKEYGLPLTPEEEANLMAQIAKYEETEGQDKAVRNDDDIEAGIPVDENDNLDNENSKLEAAKAEAKELSRIEGCVKHVSHDGKISDWYDSDNTVASYEFVMELNENDTTEVTNFKPHGKQYIDGIGNIEIEKYDSRYDNKVKYRIDGGKVIEVPISDYEEGGEPYFMIGDEHVELQKFDPVDSLLEQNSDELPNDIKWRVVDVAEKLDVHNSAVEIEGTSESTGKTYRATAMGTDMGGGDWEFEDIELIDALPSKLNENKKAAITEWVKRVNLLADHKKTTSITTRDFIKENDEPNAISLAKSDAKHKQNFYQEAIDYVGGEEKWNSLSREEQESILGDIEKDWDRSKNMGEADKIDLSKVDNPNAYTDDIFNYNSEKNGDAWEDFRVDGSTHISNTGGIEVELDPSGDGLRYRIHTGEGYTEPVEAEIEYDEEGEPYFMHGEIKWELNNFMRSNRNMEENISVMKKFQDQYGKEKGKNVYYATANKQERDPETFKMENNNDLMESLKRIKELNKYILE